MKKLLLAALAASSTYIYAGGLDRDVYKNLSSKSIDTIKSSDKFLISPDEFGVASNYESQQSYGNKYGAHLRGYITIPQTGNYVFYLASDDNGELYISTDGTASNKQKIASVSGYTGYQEFGKFESQESAVFALAEGQVIFTEAFMAEGGGSDHLSVAWSINGGPIELINGDHLTPYFEDIESFSSSLSETIVSAEAAYDSSASSIGSNPGQFTDAMRANLEVAITEAKSALESSSSDGRPYYVADLKLKKALDFYTGGLIPVKLNGNAFGALPAHETSRESHAAFDGDSGSYYQFFAPDNGFVGLDLGEGNETAVTSIKYLPKVNSNNRFKSNKFQGSLDGISFVDLFTISADPEGGWQEIQITDTTAYRFYRYYDVSGSKDWSIISELEFYGYANQDLRLLTSEVVNLVGETTNQVISESDLKIDQGGLLAQFLSYNLKTLPINGTLGLNGTALEIDGTFTQKDINEGLLTYSNIDSRKADSFTVELSSSIGGLVSDITVYLNIDSDFDGLSDEEEINLGTDYNLADTDGDGLSDSWEQDNGLNALENNSASQSAAINGGKGLSASYVFGSFRNLSDFNSKSPAKVEKVSAINFTGSTWESLSKSGAKDYVGAVFSGYLYVPTQGNYKFLLNSDDGSRLYIGGTQVLDNDGLHGAQIEENTINLSEGFHKIRCEYFERTGGQICVLQWQGPGISTQVIPASHFFLSLDEHEDLIDAIDQDQDGLTDKLELQEGSDPLNPDTDGDRLLDGEEYHAMYNYKTDTQSVDTDSDTVSDYDEIFVFHSNPLVPDFDGSILDKISIVPINTSSRLGSWQDDGDEVFAQDRRGALEYSVDVTIPGIYKLDIVGTQNRAGTNRPLFDLHLYIDGEFVERFEHSINDGEDKTFSFITPYLSGGSHTIKVFWDNTYRATSLRVKSLEMSRPGGPDSNENGYPDWIDSYIDNYYSLDSYDTNSKISPAQIEGKGRYLYKINTSVEDAIQRGTYSRWFSNVTLDKTAPKEFRIDFEDGLKSVNGAITWTQTNILDEGEIKIPVDSSMLLNAIIDEDLEGSSVIIVNNGDTEETFNADPETPVEYKFDTPGTYTIQADYSGSETKSALLTIHVIGVSNVDSPYVWRGKERAWSWQGLTSEIKLEATGMEFSPEGTGFLLKRHEVLTEVNIVARLGENGPILKSLPTLGFWLRDAVEGYLDIVETYEDGTDLTNSLAFAHQLPEGMDIKVNTISGVTFLDGSRSLVLTKDDFNELGQWTLELYNSADRDGASCHWYKIYQDGVLVGQQNK